jgi:prepilin-type N-terminal cleavage/methylation domain-containing protein
VIAMQRTRAQAGFTLVELIVTIGLIALLMGLLLPALGGSRKAAVQTRTLAEIRGAAQLITLYADAHGDVYPMSDASVMRNQVNWYQNLLDVGLISHVRELGKHPFGVEEDPPPFAISASMFGPAEMFTPGMAESIYLTKARPMRQSSVRYPSAKGFLCQWLLEWPDGFWCCPPDPDPGPVVMVDHSALIARPTDFDVSLRPDHDKGVGTPVLSTWFGVLGADKR